MAKKTRKNWYISPRIAIGTFVVILLLVGIYLAFSPKHVAVPVSLVPTPTPHVDISTYQDTPQQTITSGGFSRSFYVQLPQTLPITGPVPVIIAFHGRGDSGAGMYSYSRLQEIDETKNFLVIYPDAYAGDSYNDGRNWSAAQSAGVDDVQFTKDILDDVAVNIPIDRKNIYVI